MKLTMKKYAHFSERVLANQAHRQVLLGTFGFVLWGVSDETTPPDKTSGQTAVTTREKLPAQKQVAQQTVPTAAKELATSTPRATRAVPNVSLMLLWSAGFLWVFEEKNKEEAAAFIRDVSFFQTGVLADVNALMPALFKWPVLLKGDVEQSEPYAIQALTHKIDSMRREENRFILLDEQAQHWVAKCQLQIERTFSLPLEKSADDKRHLWRFLSGIKQAD